MFLGLLAIIITDCMLYLIIRLVDSATTRQGQLMPLHYAAVLLVFCCVAHYGATAAMARAIAADADKWKVLAASAGCGLIPILTYVSTLFRHPTLKGFTECKKEFEEARRLEQQGNAAGAIRFYRQFFEAHPDRHDALFHAAALLIAEKQDGQACGQLRKVMELFPDDPDVVSQAQRWIRHIQRGTAEFILGTKRPVQKTGSAPEAPKDELVQLAALKKQGVITESEYQSRRREIYDRAPR